MWRLNVLNVIIDYITRTALRSVFIGQYDLTVRSKGGFCGVKERGGAGGQRERERERKECIRETSVELINWQTSK